MYWKLSWKTYVRVRMMGNYYGCSKVRFDFSACSRVLGKSEHWFLKRFRLFRCHLHLSRFFRYIPAAQKVQVFDLHTNAMSSSNVFEKGISMIALPFLSLHQKFPNGIVYRTMKILAEYLPQYRFLARSPISSQAPFPREFLLNLHTHVQKPFPGEESLKAEERCVVWALIITTGVSGMEKKDRGCDTSRLTRPTKLMVKRFVTGNKT